MAHNPLVSKLRNLFPEHEIDHHTVRIGPSRQFEIGTDIIPPNSTVSHTSLLLSGFACRYKMMNDGRRAIIGFVIPGDFTNLLFSEDELLDFGVAANVRCEVVNLSTSWIAENEHLALGFRVSRQMDQAVMRTWLANIGHCPAEKRTAHLLCELRQRLAMVGLADSDSFNLSITQSDLADALGLSDVHVNRTLQHLRLTGLIRIVSRVVFFPDLSQLEKFAGFDPSYLLGQASDKTRYGKDAVRSPTNMPHDRIAS